jgi:hypothetical protein
MMVSTRSIFSCCLAVLAVASFNSVACAEIQVEERNVVPRDTSSEDSMSMSFHEHQRRKLTWDLFGFLMMSTFIQMLCHVGSLFPPDVMVLLHHTSFVVLTKLCRPYPLYYSDRW